jgi:Cu(I)/Ag(I) efflux system membrane fusion protein
MSRIFAIIFVALAAVAGYLIGHGSSVSQVLPKDMSDSKVAYVCPMHSHIVSDHPGACPICGMDLVAAGNDNGAQQIHVDTALQQKFGVRLAPAEVQELAHDIITYGTIVAGEGTSQRITASVDGMIDKVHVHPGQQVQRGQPLYDISSQDALAIQNEYIDLVRRNAPVLKIVEERREQHRKAMAEAKMMDAEARAMAERQAEQSLDQIQSMVQPIQRDRDRVLLRLRQIGLGEEQAARMAESGQALRSIPVRARDACVVKDVMARPGMTVGAMSEVMTCADLRRGGLDVVLYPDQLGWTKDGDVVSIETAAGDMVEAHMNGLAGQLDSTSRTLRVRLAIATEQLGRVGDYVAVTIHAAPRRVLSVPRSAVMRSGHGNFVMRAMGHGHFMPVRVATGIESVERVAIIDGLAAGEEVAVNGQFLLDAAASIADAVQRMQSGSAAKAGAAEGKSSGTGGAP